MTGDENDPAILLRQFEAAVSGMNLADVQRLRSHLSLVGEDPTRPAKAQLRRPPRAEAEIFRVRVDLDHARPPIWRRLDLRSDLTLDVVHQALQTAFAWTDSHLHRFALGGGPFDRDSELFLCPYDVEEGDDRGAAAAGVRLDETIQDPDDLLRYVYDYGDSWELTLRLEEVLPAADNSPLATCVDGRRAAPPEDCGGITDATDLAKVLDDPAHFEADEINQSLRDPYFVLRESGVHPRLADLVNRLAYTDLGDDLVARMLALAEPVAEPSPNEMIDGLKACQWFLDRASGGGIELTAAGYLKPADVEAASRVVPVMTDWIGTNNREVHARPLLDFRQSLRSMGLLRKYKGRLLLTRDGAKARRDPTVLWNHLASRLVPGGKSAFAEEGALLVLAYAATSPDGRVPLERIAKALHHLGWRRSDQRPLETWDLYHFEHSPFDILWNVGDQPSRSRVRDTISPMAIALARASLRHK